jgi:hypothetical protein
MVGLPRELEPVCVDTLARCAQGIEILTDLEGNVVEADAPTARRFRRLADLDQEQLVVGAAAAQHGRAVIEDGANDIEPDHVAVEGERALEITDEEDDMGQLGHSMNLLANRTRPDTDRSRPENRDSARPAHSGDPDIG